MAERGYRSSSHCFYEYSTNQAAPGWRVKTEKMEHSAADIGIADRRCIDEATFKIGPDGGGTIQRITPPETAIHALTLLKGAISYLDHAGLKWLGLSAQARGLDKWIAAG